MFRRIGLKNDSAFFFRSARSARNLRYELEGALARAIITKIQRGVRFENTHECDVAEVVTFCNHLRADEHVRFLVAERGKNLEITVLSHCRVVVHTQDSDVRNEIFSSSTTFSVPILPCFIS